MKTPSNRSLPKGFTLIELLVVIAIIAVLASAGFAVGPAMMNKAKRLSAQATATAIANSVEQFYTDYSALPDPGSTSADTEFTSSDAALLDILAGGTKATSISQNPRKIRYLSVKEAKNGLDGAVYTGTSIDKIVDPFGKPYYIVLDYDYDERLTLNPGGTGSVTLNGRRVAVYSHGVRGTDIITTKTLAKSW